MIILSVYGILLIVLLMESLMYLGLWGLLVYFVLGLLLAVPMKLYFDWSNKRQEEKEMRLQAYLNSLPTYHCENDLWDNLSNYAV